MPLEVLKCPCCASDVIVYDAPSKIAHSAPECLWFIGLALRRPDSPSMEHAVRDLGRTDTAGFEVRSIRVEFEGGQVRTLEGAEATRWFSAMNDAVAVLGLARKVDIGLKSWKGREI